MPIEKLGGGSVDKIKKGGRMKKRRIAFIGLLVISLASLVAACVPTAPGITPIRWGTSKVGSTGYMALVGVTTILGKEMPDYSFSVYPQPGAIASMKAYADGDLEACYGADVGFIEMYNVEKRFEAFVAKRMPVQTFWSYTLETTLAVHAGKTDAYQKWGDIAGKKVFDGPLGWDVRANLVKSLDILGVTFEHIEVDIKMVADALEKGDIEATLVYTTAGASPAPWIREVEIATDIAILNPSTDEIDKLKAAGVWVTEIDPEKAYATDVHVDTIYACPFYYGFHVGVEIPEEVVYRMLTVLDEHKGDLATYDPGFEALAEDFVGMQVRGISSIPDVPVHPGLAKFLKEHAAWEPEWEIAS